MMTTQTPSRAPSIDHGGAGPVGTVALVAGLLALASIAVAWIAMIVDTNRVPPVPFFGVGTLLGLTALITGLVARRSVAGRAGIGLGAVAMLGIVPVFLLFSRASRGPAPEAAVSVATEPAIVPPVAAPAPPVAPSDPALALPASFGVAECDAYARRACTCSDGRIRAAMCSAATQSFASWRNVPPAGRATLARGCSASTASIVPSCP